jgi:hypothetical protein
MAFNTAKGDPIISEKKELQKPIIETSNPTPPSHQLSAVELAFLLNMISQSTFEGNQIETTYNTVIKLQNQFLEQSK